MNIPYEAWGNTLRENAERIGEAIIENETVRQLAEKGAEFGGRITESEALRQLAAKGAKVARAYRRKKTAALLAAGFAGGVAATLLAVKAVDHLKRVRRKAHELKLVREEQKDYADVGEPTEE